MLTEQEARAGPLAINWTQAMKEFLSRRQDLIDSGCFALVYTNGYVMLKSGDVVWHTQV